MKRTTSIAAPVQRVFPSTASNGNSTATFTHPEWLELSPRAGFFTRLKSRSRKRATSRSRTCVQAALSPSDRTLPSRGPWLASGLSSPTGSELTMTSSEPLSSTRQLMYSLSSHPTPRAGRREGPQFTRCTFSCVPSPVPRWTERLHLAVASPPVLAFANSVVARHPQDHASWFVRDTRNEADRFACATARTMASPSPTKDVYCRAFAGCVTTNRRRL